MYEEFQKRLDKYEPSFLLEGADDDFLNKHYKEEHEKDYNNNMGTAE